MLNRLYIVVGVLLILLLTAAFLVPRFYDWSPYRERMEQIATDALGTEVRIQGDLSFVLLPQPQMHVSKVQLGPLENPFVEIERVDANLALMQFFRDQYDVQKLDLHELILNVAIAEDGGFEFPITLSNNSGRNNVSIEQAQLINGSILFSDKRADEHWRLENINGELSAAGLRGPFAFEGQGELDQVQYDLRINSSDLNQKGDIRLKTFVSPRDQGFSISSEGVLSTASLSPFYDGGFRVSVAPRNLEENEVRGNALFEGKIQLDPTRLKLTEFSVLPDENRAGTRLTGALDVSLGAQRTFEAVVSGGVVPLLPQDALSQSEEDPYALVTLLTSLPAPPQLGNVAGRLSIDVADLGLRSTSLRNVLVDATTDGESWQIEQLSARLAGDTSINLSGVLIEAQGNAAFDGMLEMSTERLDALARAWRSFGDRNPLFGATASLATQFGFSSSGATFSNGLLKLDDQQIRLNIDWREEDVRRLDINAELSAFGADASAKLFAMLPDPSRPLAFNNSFPTGKFSVQAAELVVADLPTAGLITEGSWTEYGILIDRYSIREAHGVRLQGAGEIQLGESGVTALFGSARADVNDDGDLPRIINALTGQELPSGVAAFATRNRPARLDLELTAPENESQTLFVSGDAKDILANGRFDFGAGIFGAFSAPSSGEIEFKSSSAAALAEQFGLDAELFELNTEATLKGAYNGTIGNSVEVAIGAQSGEDEIVYQGSLIVSNLGNVRGTGELRFALSNTEPVFEPFGFKGFPIPALSGRAKLKVAGANELSVTEIVARASDEDVAGSLSIRRLGDRHVVGGDLKISRIDLSGFGVLLGGRAATITPEGALWPNGPFAVVEGARNSRGRVHVETPIVLVNSGTFLSDVSFDVSWTPTENRVRNLIGTRGQGEVTADVSLCCYGSTAQKQMSGRFSFEEIDMDDLVPDAISGRISGGVSGSGQFSGIGVDFAEVISSLGGDGSFSVTGVALEDFDPQIFEKVAAVQNVLELEAEELEQIVLENLEGTAFVSPGFEGLFRIAAGRILSTNLALEDQQTRLFGGANLRLSDLGLESNWTLSPTQNVGDGSILNETNARVDVVIGGTLSEPEYRIDIQQMVDAIQVKAFELEVDRLEKLRAEQEARAKAQAEEQQRRMAEQAAELAKEEARKAAIAAEAERIQREKAAAEKAAAEALEQNDNGSVIELPGLTEGDDPILLLDPNELFDPNAPFDPSVTDEEVPVDLLGGN